MEGRKAYPREGFSSSFGCPFSLFRLDWLLLLGKGLEEEEEGGGGLVLEGLEEGAVGGGSFLGVVDPAFFLFASSCLFFSFEPKTPMIKNFLLFFSKQKFDEY